MDFDLAPLWISLKTAFVATIFAFGLGIVAAHWLFGYRGQGKGVIDGLLTLPLVLPPTVVGFLLLLLLGRSSPLGQLLMRLGIPVIFSWPATVIAATIVAFPLMYKTALAAFEQVDPDFLQAARTLGATESRIFWQILLPLAWPGVVAGTILAFARALGEFGATLMLAGSIPGQTQTIPIAIFLAAESGEMTQALNWVLIMVVISLAVIVGLNYGSQAQRPRNSSRPNPLLHPLFNWLILSRSPLRFQRRGIQSSSLTPAQPSQEGLEAKRLWVDLQKHLPGFGLETKFTAAHQPLGLLGTSGSGKSMTLRCLAGLETPTQGQIVLNGRVLFDSRQGINLPSRDRRIGVVFQNYALFPHLSVAQNIAFGLQALAPATRKRRVDAYLEQMQLQGLKNRYPHQLSGGQQQRVALARALAIEPEALLLDEPLSALDTYLRSQVEKLLIETLRDYPGVTLFVTHKLEEVYRVCSHLLVLSAGKIIAAGSKAEIFERPASFKVVQVTECKNFSQARRINSQTIEAVDWNCNLRVVEPIPIPLTYVGIRAHHLRFTNNPNQENTFPCWLIETSETQHRMTVYLRLHQPPRTATDTHHLQVEVYRQQWADLKDHPFPWHVKLEPLRLILMRT